MMNSFENVKLESEFLVNTNIIVNNSRDKIHKECFSKKQCNLTLQKKLQQIKTRKKINRFDGSLEDDVAKKLLPDHLAKNLDILIIGINPGLFAAHKGHHYAGPGNHFWKCLYLSGLTPELFTAYDDFKMLDHGLGFTNIVARTTRGSADLSKKEIQEGAEILMKKLKEYQPKIAVFNGKGIYEIFSKKKNFHFGKQPELIPGTSTHIWVMPSSSARCAQLPRAIDKVPFYVALKNFRDHLNGLNPSLTEKEIVFSDFKLTSPKKKAKMEEKTEILKDLKSKVEDKNLKELKTEVKTENLKEKQVKTENEKEEEVKTENEKEVKDVHVKDLNTRFELPTRTEEFEIKEEFLSQ